MRFAALVLLLVPVTAFSPSSRRIIVRTAATAALAAAAPPATAQNFDTISIAAGFAPGVSAGWREEKDRQLDAAYKKAAEKDALCKGRRAQDKELGGFDLTFDPPCYISGIYVGGLFVSAVAALKVAQIVEEKKMDEAAAVARAEQNVAAVSRSEQDDLNG